ncbi:MAG TPA: hypothetical protein VK644_04010 [Chitinophagaceae bacterium]|nr:hypothetical protein [Chitinophagaceae bacterium]
MEVHLKIIGVLLIILSLIHVVFPYYFKWKEELNTLSLVNRQMIYVHTFFISVTIFLMGILCLSHAHELFHTNLGRSISLGLAIFWFLRLLFQFFVYSPSLWKGKSFETVIHIIFSGLWIYLTVVFFLTWYM